MNKVEELIARRHSTRKYSPRSVEIEKIKKIIESVRLAPSTCNAQPWRFITFKNTKDFCDNVLGGLVPNRWAYSAPVMIVCCIDKNILAHKLASYIKGIDFAMIDMGIAIEHLILAACEMGLGTCVIGWFNKKKLKQILEIPRGIDVVALITLGYPNEKSEVKRTQRLELDEILYFNRWGGREKKDFW